MRHRKLGVAIVLCLLVLLGLREWRSHLSPTNEPSQPAAAAAKNPHTREDPRLSRCDELRLAPCQRQVVHQSIPISGSNVHLAYQSDRVPGRKIDSAPATTAIGLGGWSLDILSSLDPVTRTLTSGSGELRHVNPMPTDIAGGRLAVSDLDGRRVAVFDERGREVAVFDSVTGARVLLFQWNRFGLAGVLDRGGVALTIVRDRNGIATRIDSVRGPKTRLAISGGSLVTVRDSLGHVSHIGTGAAGLITSISDFNGGTTHFDYDENGRLTAEVNASGIRTTYTREFTDTRALVTTAGPLGAISTDTTTLLANGGFRFEHHDAQGGTLSDDTSRNRRALKLPDGTGLQIELQEDPRWGMDAPLFATVVKQDSSGRALTTVTQTRAALGSFSAPGGYSGSVSIDGKTTRYSYDVKARTYAVTDPAGVRRASVFDASGRVTTRTQGDAVIESYRYDDHGHLKERTLGSGADARTWKYTYGKTGELTVSNPLGISATLKSTPTDGVSGITGPATADVALERDANNFITRFNAAGQGNYWIRRREDGRLVATMAPAAVALDAQAQKDAGSASQASSGVGPLQYTLYTYDTAGRLASRAWPDAKETWTRDASGRASSVDFGAGACSYGYDSTGRIARTSGPGASEAEGYTNGSWTSEQVQGPFDVTYTRETDPVGRVLSETVASQSPVAFEYDDSGLLAEAGHLHLTRDPRSGLVHTEQLGSLVLTWTYNALGEPLSQEIVGAGGTRIARIEWERDRLGRVISKMQTTHTGPSIRERYDYDARGALHGWSRGSSQQRYEYDLAGNLIRTTRSDGPAVEAKYDRRNELIERAGTKYSYNGAGQRIAEASTGRSVALTYDTRGALLQVTRSGARDIRYQVDCAGRRIVKSVDGKTARGFVYRDGSHPAAELDGAGTVQLRYVYDSQGPLLYVTKDGKDYLEVLDANGSPLLVIDAQSGAIVDAITRDPFGHKSAETAPGFQSVGFAGGLEDDDTALVRFGARDYDPQTATWTAPDPLSIASGAPNLYRYVESDPVNRTDALGLFDQNQLGVSGTFVPGAGVTVGAGIAWTATDWGFYVTGGFALGAEGGLSGGYTGANTGNHSTDIEGINGWTTSGDLGLGVFSFGPDIGTGGSVGGHFNLGPSLGVSGQLTDTQVIPMGSNPGWGFPDPPKDGPCEGVDAGLCDPSPDNPDGGADAGGQADAADAADAGADSGASGGNGGADESQCSSSADCGNPGDGEGEDDPSSNAGTGATYGDPHLRTLDGIFFDFMGVGEWTALESDSGDLLVQVRQQPLGHSRTIAVTRAAAMKVMGDRVLVNSTKTLELDIVVNGTPFTASTSRVLPGGATIRRTTTGLAIRLKDGSRVIVRTTAIGFDVLGYFAAGRYGHLHGLLGPFTRTRPSEGVMTRDGQLIRPKQLEDRGTRYHVFGDSWRISRAGSLFEYAKGESTETFTDRSFPDVSHPEPPSRQQASAQALCAALNLPPEALRACVMDVSVTGEAGLAASVAAATDIRGQSSAIPLTLETISPGATVRDQVSEGASRNYPFDAAAGTAGYFAGAEGCKTSNGVRFNIESDDGSKVLGGSDACMDLGRIVFPADGKYRLRVFATTGGGGNFEVHWKPSRPDAHATLQPGADAAGSIDLAGAYDVYDLTANTDTVGYFAADEHCQSGTPLRWTLETTDRSRILSVSDICHDAGRIVMSGPERYLLRVYGAGAGTGAYRVHWIPSRLDRHGTLQADASAAGTIEVPGALDLYDFDVSEGTVGYFAAAPNCSSPDSLRWSIEAADHSRILAVNSICHDAGRIAFSSAGHYQLRVSGSDRGTGPYSIRWMRSRPDKHFSLSAGQNASGAIDLPGALDLYALSGTVGAARTFRAAPDCAQRGKLRWRIESADGAHILGDSDVCSDLGPVEFGRNDSYVLRVYGVDTSTGSYRVSWR